MEPVRDPTRNLNQQVRDELRRKLATDTDFNTFCQDYFREVHQLFAVGMDRLMKENLLLQKASPKRILKSLIGSLDMKDRKSEQRSICAWIDLDTRQPLPPRIQAELAQYGAELDVLMRAWDELHRDHDVACEWLNKNWTMDVARWLVRLAGSETLSSPLSGEEWLLLLSAPWFVATELQHTVPTRAQSLSTILEVKTAKAWPDVSSQSAFVDFLSTHGPLVERAQRIATSIPGTSTAAQEKLAAIADWLRYRFAKKIRARWELMQMRMYRQTQASLSIAQLLAGRAASRPRELEKARLWHGRLLRIGCMSGQEIHSWLSEVELRNGAVVFDERRVRFPLLATLLLLAERLAVQPIDLGETILHHLDIDPALTPALVCAEVSQQVDVDLTASSRQLIVRARCRHNVVDFALNELAQDIDALLRGELRRLQDRLDVGTFLPPTCIADVEPAQDKSTGHDYYRKPHLSFTLEAHSVRTILMGTQLWEKRELAYRELYQNALDACRYRRCRSSYRGVAYQPQIRFHEGWDHSGRYFVECEDNGIGMDMNLLSNCFARAGNRFRDSGSFAQERREWESAKIPDFMYPNSQFGIGVFSYFLVADELEVETCRLRTDAVGTETRYRVRIPAAASVFTVDEIADTIALSGYYQRQTERNESIDAAYRPGAGSRIRLYLTKQLSPRRQPEQGSTLRTERCIDTLERLVWFTDVAMVATAYDRTQPSVWEPRKLSPRVAQYVEPVQGLDETQHFWVIKPGLVSRSATDPHYVPLAGLDYSREIDLEQWEGPLGRVLADGIATEHVVPCAIVNLWRDEQPTLSVDRQRIRHYAAERVRARFADPERLRARPSGEPADGRWLHSLFDAWPAICQRLVMERVQARQTWTYHPNFLLDSQRWNATFADHGFCPADTAILWESAKELFLTGAPLLPSSLLLLAVWRCSTWEFPAQRSGPGGKLALDPLHYVPTKSRLALRSQAGYPGMPTHEGSVSRELETRWIDAEVKQKWRETLLTPVESYFLTELNPYVTGRLAAEFKQSSRASALFTNLSHSLNRNDASWLSAMRAAVMRTLATFNHPDVPRSWCLERIDQLLAVLDEGPLPPLGRAPDMLPLVEPEDLRLLGSIKDKTIGPDLLAAKWRANQSLPTLVDRLIETAIAYGIAAPTIPLEALDKLSMPTAEDWQLLSQQGDGNPPWLDSDRSSFFSIVNRLMAMNLSESEADARLERIASVFGWTLSMPAPESKAILETLSADDKNLLSCSFDGRRPWIMDQGTAGEHAVGAALRLGQPVAACAARLNALAPALGWPSPPFSAESLSVFETMSSDDFILLGYSPDAHPLGLPSIASSLRFGSVVNHVYLAARRLGQPVAKCAQRLQTLAAALGMQDSLPSSLPSGEILWPTWMEESGLLEHYVFGHFDEAWQSPGLWLWLAGHIRRPAHEVLAFWNQLREQLSSESPPVDIDGLKSLEPITHADFQLFNWNTGSSAHTPLSLQTLGGRLGPSNFRWYHRRSPLAEIILLAFFTVDRARLQTEFPRMAEVYRRYLRYNAIATAIGLPHTAPQFLLQHQELMRLCEVEYTLLLTLAVWGEVTLDEALGPEQISALPPEPIAPRRTQCGRLIALAALIHRPLYWIAERLSRWQSSFGTAPPNDDATYLGLRWDTLVERSRRDHPGFAQDDECAVGDAQSINVATPRQTPHC